MMEHRLIEKMLVVADRKAATMDEHSYDPIFVDTIVDFIKTYADRTHHGKEENILFVDLGKKELNMTDKLTMSELINEHRQAREKVARIVELNERYKGGERAIVGQIKEIIAWLASFYPVHIKKEDDRFFPDTEKYFDEKEMDEMLERFWEFDRDMIHEKYRKLYESLSP
jgi:hemerythrin-like domain-containing protein